MRKSMSSKKANIISKTGAIIIAVLLFFIDRVTKRYIVANFALYEGCPFLKGIIDIRYIENRGAAWGMFQGETIPLIVITGIVSAVCVFCLVKYGKNKLFFWSVCLVLSGGVGNMIDRVFRGGSVVDFLHFEFWPSFPVFNIADCAVVIGGGMLVLYFVLDIINEYKKKRGEKETDGKTN